MRVQPATALLLLPMALQRLVDTCRSMFDGSHTPLPADIVSSICGMIDKIKPDDVGLMDEFGFSDEMNSSAGCQNPPIIACKIIHDCNTFTITVFFLPPAATMPLHNHPGMTVFSKVLVGSAHVVSYDWVHPRVCATTGSPEPGTTTTMLAEKVLDDRFTAASGAWALFPDAGGNLHRFVAGEDAPCALLDVMTPPYSSASEAHAQQRFAYYQEIPYELHHLSHGTDVGGELTEEQKCRQLAWLQEIGDEPKDLRISNLPYRGPPIA